MHRENGIRLEWLRSFLAVADSGGYSKGARALHMSQPAVSTHVKELETSLGAKLLEKIGGKVRLTASGEAAAADAREILEGVRRLRDSAGRLATEVGGTLAVGASTTPGNYLLPALLGRFERENPGVRTRLLIGNSAHVLGRLLKNEVDLGAVGLKPSAPDFLSERLATDEIVLFVHREHPLARARGLVNPAELARHRFLVRESDSATRRHGDGWFAKHKIRPSVMELGCPETLKRSVAAGLGVGVLSRFAVGAEGGETDFRVLTVPGFPIRRQLFMCWLKRKRLNRTMTSFLDLAKASYNK
ncbi:MAG TPA: LysR substrate-binding domain-containing protein [Planctomycetota bacterium]|nr:LysR substrate-binding domain-containing protein [Planctomycetota bacterium]